MGWKRDFQRNLLQTSILERLGLDFGRFWDRILQLLQEICGALGSFCDQKSFREPSKCEPPKRAALPVPCQIRFILGGFGAQDASKTAQDASKTAQDASKNLKMRQDAPKTPPRRGKTPPRRPKTPPRRPKTPQEVPRRLPRPSQIHPKSILMLKTSKIKKSSKNQWKISDFQGFGDHFSEVTSIVFRLAFMGYTQDVPRRSQDVLRRPQDAPKTPQDAPWRFQDDPKTPPRRPQDGPRRSQDGPRRSQDAPKTPHKHVSGQ